MILPPQSQQIRALADCDSFFASCEVARNPGLQGLPVCVGRDIVIAATYEAKAKWIKTGTPVWEAKRILWSRGVYCDTDFKLYFDKSKDVMNILRETCISVEPYSIDEAFCDMTWLSQKSSRANELTALHIQKHILRETWIPVSFGIWPTRLIAKTFSKLRKPFGVYGAISHDDIMKTINTLALTDLPYIATRSANKLSMCRTIGDFYRLDGSIVKKTLGWSGLKLWLELHSVNTFSGSNHSRPKSMRNSRSFNPDFTKIKEKLWEKLLLNFEKLYRDLLNEKMKCKHIYLWLRTKDFDYHSGKKILPDFTNDKHILLDTVKELFDKVYKTNTFYRTTGIGICEFNYQHYQNRCLFDDSDIKTKNRHVIHNIMNSLNNKYWKTIVSFSKNNSLEKKKIGFYGL